MTDCHYTSAGAWARRFHLASRAMMERILRPYDLGATQWHVLNHLATSGPTRQRDFPKLLQIEKPALSEVVATLVRKGLVSQDPDIKDRRQRLLSLTEEGAQLWADLPDPLVMIQGVAFEGIDRRTQEMVGSALRAATEQLNAHVQDADGK
ncbi:MarR family winged helix-turn-helix transcriptional regulator [Chachezhania sediminis]|uniref:MarR family winged helix-turn-helix transcriptional regulator n=1 Tax=Chachezhania sediminis TaxID=2599291 RepID=UPI00131D0D0E|nr:MarR family transcriptional regulator [Chachezhania sediminis]